MRKILIGALLLNTFSAFAYEHSFDAVVRNERNKAIIEEVALKDLISPDSFEGEHFKIVIGKSNDAIRFNNQNQGILLRAATTYYHLTRAREYFVNKIKSDYVAKMPQMTIRVELKNQFSEVGHFAHDNYEPKFNNADTVPAGEGLASRGVTPWGLEIWFRPKKEVNLKDIKVNGLANREMLGLLRVFRNQIHMQSLQRFMAQTVTALVAKNGQVQPWSMDNLVRMAGSSLLIESGYQFIDPISRLTARQWYWSDTALVPEIIYHEYSHAALSDYLVLSHSSSVNEGMADFFASQIADSPTIAKNIKEYNTYNGKNAERKQKYMAEFEMDEYANTDFVFGLLWEMKKVVGYDIGEEFMFELRKKITTNSTIRNQLIEGIFETCREKCKVPFNDSVKIMKALNLRNF